MLKRSEKGYILAKKALKRATKMGTQWVPFGKNPRYQHWAGVGNIGWWSRNRWMATLMIVGVGEGSWQH